MEGTLHLKASQNIVESVNGNTIKPSILVVPGAPTAYNSVSEVLQSHIIAGEMIKIVVSLYDAETNRIKLHSNYDISNFKAQYIQDKQIISLPEFTINTDSNQIFIVQQLTLTGTVQFQTLLDDLLVTPKTQSTVISPAEAQFSLTNIKYLTEQNTF